MWPGKLWGQRLYIVVWPGKLLADSYFFIFCIYFNKTYIQILCYNNHAHTPLNQSSDTNDSYAHDEQGDNPGQVRGLDGVLYKL